MGWGGAGGVGSGLTNNKGFWDASVSPNGTPDYSTTLIDTGDFLRVSTAGTRDITGLGSTSFAVGDSLIKTATGFAKLGPSEAIDLGALTANSIPLFNGTGLVDSSIQELTNIIRAAKSLGTTAESIEFSEALSIGSAGEAFSLHDAANNRRGYLIGYERENDGSGRPFWRKLNAIVTGQEIQPLKDTNTGTQNITIPITFTANRLITSVILESTETVSDASLTIERNGVEIESKSGISFTANTETAISLPQGIICSNGQQLDLVITGVILKGTGTVGTDFELFIKLDNHIWEKVNLLDATNALSELNTKFVAGTDITIDYDSGADTLTFNSTASGGATFNPADHSVTEFNDVTNAGSGAIITSLERNKLSGLTSRRTDTEFYTEVKSIMLAGTGTQITANDTDETLTISSTTASFDAPRITNFSINIASRVDLNTDLNVSHTLTYDVLHFGNIQSLTLDIQNGTNQALTLPTQDGASQTQDVVVSGTNTATENTIIFKITGVDTQGNNFESNDYTVSVRTLDDHEYIYYGFSTSNNPDTVDVSTLTSREAATESFTVNFGPSTTEGEYNIILAPSDHLLSALTDSLNINQLTPPTSWVTTSNVRTIGTTQYTSYVLGPLAQGYTATLTLEVS